MEEFTENKYIRNSLLSTDYKFFTHLKRGKGIGRVKKEDILVFPEICALCGSEDIHGVIGIGKPNLYIFSNVGYVPYCKDHYNLISAIQENYVFSTLSMLGILLIAMVLGGLIFGFDKLGALEGVLYLVGIPVFVIIRYIANRKFRNKLGLDMEAEKLIAPVSCTYYISISIALAAAIIGYFTGVRLLYAISVLIAFLGLAYDQANRRTGVDSFIETNKILKLGAVQIAVIHPKFYSVGFLNIDFYLKFMELNRERVISSVTYDVLLQKRDIL
jgi:hypothetical protein